MKYDKIKVHDKFGQWEVLSLIDSVRVHCRCSCGTEKDVMQMKLKRGESTSCGCKKLKYLPLHPGDVIGCIKLINKIESEYWDCQCLKCGESGPHRVEYLHKGIGSCRCQTRRYDKLKVGSIYDQWKVLKVIDGHKALCLCKCGTIREVIQASLKTQESKSCGCQSDKVRKQTIFEKIGYESYSDLPERRNNLNIWHESNPDFSKKSKNETNLLTWIRQFYPSARKYKKDNTEIDIFIPELKIGIEYNGLYWHCEPNLKARGKDPINYHLNKTKYFNGVGNRLIHIFEHEYVNNESQVKSFLLSAIKKNQFKINLRDCQIIKSTSLSEIQTSEKFLDKYHIQQRSRNIKFVCNIYYHNELISTATFGIHHRDNKNWVLSRFCTKTNYTIRGALGKITKLASEYLKSDIISWGDRRWTDGNGYIACGWNLEKTHPPGFFYHNQSTNKIISKQSRQKKFVNTPEHMTELEHATLDGLVRIWDCGKIRFRYKYQNYENLTK